MSLVLFSSFLNVLQFVGIILVAVLMSFVSQLIYKKFSDQDALKDLNDRIKQVRKEMKGLKDPDRLMKLNDEMLRHSNAKMRLIMKPMMISSMIFIISFYVWSNLFKGFNLFIFSDPLPIIGNDVGWLLTYVFASVIVSSAVRKKMGVQL